MTIFERAKEVILKPALTWQSIKKEEVGIKQLMFNYAAPLALIPAVCTLIGWVIFGVRMPTGNWARAPFFEALLGGVIGYILSLGGVYLGAWLVNLVAPYFHTKSDLNAAGKLIIFSLTPFWLVGIFAIMPSLSFLSILGLYGLYLLWMGIPVIFEIPNQKMIWFFLAIIGMGVVVNFIISILLVGSIYGPMYMKMMAS